jgi:hypothetical protein
VPFVSLFGGTHLFGIGNESLGKKEDKKFVQFEAKHF